MKVLQILGLTTMSIDELHRAIDDLPSSASDAPIVVLGADDSVIPLGRVEWDAEMRCYVIRQDETKPAMVN